MTHLQKQAAEVRREIEDRYHTQILAGIHTHRDHLIVYVTERRAEDDVRRIVGDRGEVVYVPRRSVRDFDRELLLA